MNDVHTKIKNIVNNQSPWWKIFLVANNIILWFQNKYLWYGHCFVEWNLTTEWSTEVIDKCEFIGCSQKVSVAGVWAIQVIFEMFRKRVCNVYISYTVSSIKYYSYNVSEPCIIIKRGYMWLYPSFHTTVPVCLWNKTYW